mmetsp:Transcript_18625/g.37727  ORF Transcript_18625/g.37727 Transcript_18625/m.37727 type:complete len:618 (-) Transcript_18625:2181-4034(-)
MHLLLAQTRQEAPVVRALAGTDELDPSVVAEAFLMRLASSPSREAPVHAAVLVRPTQVLAPRGALPFSLEDVLASPWEEEHLARLDVLPLRVLLADGCRHVLDLLAVIVEPLVRLPSHKPLRPLLVELPFWRLISLLHDRLALCVTRPDGRLLDRPGKVRRPLGVRLHLVELAVHEHAGSLQELVGTRPVAVRLAACADSERPVHAFGALLLGALACGTDLRTLRTEHGRVQHLPVVHDPTQKRLQLRRLLSVEELLLQRVDANIVVAAKTRSRLAHEELARLEVERFDDCIVQRAHNLFLFRWIDGALEEEGEALGATLREADQRRAGLHGVSKARLELDALGILALKLRVALRADPELVLVTIDHGRGYVGGWLPRAAVLVQPRVEDALGVAWRLVAHRVRLDLLLERRHRCDERFLQHPVRLWCTLRGPRNRSIPRKRLVVPGNVEGGVDACVERAEVEPLRCRRVQRRKQRCRILEDVLGARADALERGLLHLLDLPHELPNPCGVLVLECRENLIHDADVSHVHPQPREPEAILERGQLRLGHGPNLLLVREPRDHCHRALLHVTIDAICYRHEERGSQDVECSGQPDVTDGEEANRRLRIGILLLGQGQLG